MTRDNYVFWDLGEEDFIRPSKVSLHHILDALVRCHGRLHDSHVPELDSGNNYRYPTTQCSVLFRISLPEGLDTKFTEISGFKLTTPPRVGISWSFSSDPLESDNVDNIPSL